MFTHIKDRNFSSYKHRVTLGRFSREDALMWCKLTMKHGFAHRGWPGFNEFAFDNKQEALFFKLMWG